MLMLIRVISDVLAWKKSGDLNWFIWTISGSLNKWIDFVSIPYREPIIQLPKQLWCSRCPSRAAEHRWFIIDINFVLWSCILKHSDWIWNQNVHDLQLTPWKFPQGFVHPGDCVYLYAKSWYSWTIPIVTKWSAIWEANQPDRQERKTKCDKIWSIGNRTMVVQYR